MRKLRTYKETQRLFKAQYGRTIKSCWIAHVKWLKALPVKEAYNRVGEDRVYPCPPEHVDKVYKILIGDKG